MKLMIVESPNKVKKIGEILGAGWTVLASSGHIRDLPQNDYGIDPTTFSLAYQFIPKFKNFPSSKERVDRIAKVAKEAEMVYLATDPDREGEAIAWHLKQVLKLKDSQYQRVTFDAITPEVIKTAITRARKINDALVHAQEGRRALDRIVGYTVSPVISSLLNQTASAGRVQSVAVRLGVDREKEIQAFRATNHFGAEVQFDNGAWRAHWNTKPFLQDGNDYLQDEPLATRAAACRQFTITKSDKKPRLESPPPPFTTALLLQAASVSLKFSPATTAKVSQSLFEQGLITYHRTDSVNFSEESIEQIRAFATEKGWKLPQKPRRFKTKGDAQEAHEAIRPTYLDKEEAGGDAEEKALYKLIWLRAIACQLADAEYSVNSLSMDATDNGTTFEFLAKGKTMVEAGWRALTTEDATNDRENADTDDDDNAGTVPLIDVGNDKTATSGKLLYKKTKAPKRYTQASLIAALEAAGVGRPSTYPAVMANIMKRVYYIEDKKRFLEPTKFGTSIVDALIKGGFKFVELSFTRAMEEDLDLIEANKKTYFNVVSTAYAQIHAEASAFRSSGVIAPLFTCPACDKPLRKIPGAKGLFWGCTGYSEGSCKSTYPDKEGVPDFEKKPTAEKAPVSEMHKCTACGKGLTRRPGKQGQPHWWGCSGFPNCKKTYKDENGRPVYTAIKST